MTEDLKMMREREDEFLAALQEVIQNYETLIGSVTIVGGLENAKFLYQRKVEDDLINKEVERLDIINSWCGGENND